MIDALPLLLGPEGYQISRSVRLRSSASAYFNRTNGTPTSGTTWTISFWMKRGSNLGTQQNIMGAGQTSGTNYFQVVLQSDNALNIDDAGAGNNLITTQVFRDPSAWYHIVYVFDSTQATASNRAKLYVNGTQVTAFSTANYPALNAVSYWNTNAYVRAIGNIWYNGAPGGFYFDGYLTEINFIDGQALTPSSFGETNTVTGVWQPKKYAGTYGTNGFYLNFSDNSAATAAAIGKDYSGNGNNWTPNNISVTAGVTYDSMLDVPTQWADGGNGRGNYCVWNPIDPNALIGGGIVDGNLLGYPANTAGRGVLKGTINLPTSGQYYFEITPTVLTSAVAIIGICKTTVPYNASSFSAGDLYAYRSTPDGWNGATTITYGASYTTNDVIGVAFDASAGTITFYKNGVSQGQAYSGISGEYTPFAADQTTGGVTQYALNCGQRPFAYTPPSGFKALNTLNLPTPTILKGNQYFDVLTWTGADTGTSRTFTGLQFAPDMFWSKPRSQAYNHIIYDRVRGAGSKLALSPSGTFSESSFTADQYGYLSTFNSDGVTWTRGSLGSGTNPDGYADYDELNATYVAWSWKEGATQGFDIVTYTGTGSNTTVAHSLGVAPRMIIVKQRNAVRGWPVYHASLTSATFYVDLQTTMAQTSAAVIWNSTAPTSSVFSVGTDVATNQSGGTYVAYLFAEVAGFSKFGSYTGNGSADGPFIFTGFLPRWVMFKRTDSTASWHVFDSARNTYNVVDLGLFPDLSSAEIDLTPNNRELDFLSNGIKIRGSGSSEFNANGGTFIYAAFASNPFKNALAR